MSEYTENNQQTIVIGLVVVAALLAAIVGVLIWQQSKASSIPAPSAATAPADPANPTGGATAAPTQAAGDETFDPKTAPKVPKGTEPEAYVREYYELCEKGKYAEAFKMLPTATQAYYKDSAGFESTLKGYGITGFDVKSAKSTAKEAKVVGIQKAQGMEFVYTWTLVKQGDDWLVKARDMGGQ